jgi:hypothetical protein
MLRNIEPGIANVWRLKKIYKKQFMIVKSYKFQSYFSLQDICAEEGDQYTIEV